MQSTADDVRVMPPSIDVLVIDDDADARELLAAVLHRAGFTVLTAGDGREALDLLHSLRPRLILVDLSMPVMNGAEFRQAQRRDREWITIPTVVMTGTHEEPLLDLAIAGTLHKPVRTRDLLELVRDHIGEAR